MPKEPPMAAGVSLQEEPSLGNFTAQLEQGRLRNELL